MNNESPTKTVEEWAQKKATPVIWFRAAKVAQRWAEGWLLDEQTYDAAIDAAQTVRCR